ncbi:hypothetical protein ABZY30_07990 [Streptomyces massasporeus]
MDGATGLRSDFVSGVLNEFEELTVAVSALRDAPFAVRVLRDQTGVDFVRLQNSRRLLDHGSQHRGRFS